MRKGRIAFLNGTSSYVFGRSGSSLLLVLVGLRLPDLIAPLVSGLHHLAGDGIDQLPLEPVPGLLADLPEAHPLAGGRGGEQRNGTGDKGQLEVAFQNGRAGAMEGLLRSQNV